MRPRELARAFGVAAPSPLASALGDRAAVSPRQAVALLGQAVHVAPVEWLLRRAATRLGLLQRRVRYASVFSGVDVAAAAMDVLWPARWSYSTAAECDAVARRALLAAWGSRGLQASAVFLDAGGAAAMAAPYADVWVCTPSCKPFSRRNHRRSEEEVADELLTIERALRYVPAVRPLVVLIENVCEPEAVCSLTAMLRRIDGYEWEHVQLCPSANFGWAMTRARHFWLGTRR